MDFIIVKPLRIVNLQMPYLVAWLTRVPKNFGPLKNLNTQVLPQIHCVRMSWVGLRPICLSIYPSIQLIYHLSLFLYLSLYDICKYICIRYIHFNLLLRNVSNIHKSRKHSTPCPTSAIINSPLLPTSFVSGSIFDVEIRVRIICFKKYMSVSISCFKTTRPKHCHQHP